MGRPWTNIIVYAHGRRLCSIWFRHGNTTISYPQCSLTFLRERYLHRCREQSFAIRAYAKSAVGIDVVSVHKLFAYRIVSTVSTDILSSHLKYCKNSKIWDTSNSCHNCPKNRKVWCNIALMHPKDADGMANSVDPDQSDLGLLCLLRPICPNT